MFDSLSSERYRQGYAEPCRFDVMSSEHGDFDQASPEALAHALRQLLRERDVNQTELAQRVGVSRPTVSNWLKTSGRPRIPDFVTLLKVLEALDSDLIELDEILYGPRSDRLSEIEKRLEALEGEKDSH